MECEFHMFMQFIAYKQWMKLWVGPGAVCARGEETAFRGEERAARMAVFPSVRRNRLVRASGGGETPVPIPNTAVKAPRGDDTAFKSAGKQRGANRFLKGPRVHWTRGPVSYGEPGRGHLVA